MSNSKLWFLRRNGGSPKGPYTTSIINNQFSLKRLKLNDEISDDKNSWYQLSQWLDLQNIEPNQNNIKHLDERDGFDRRKNLQAGHPSSKRINGERRLPEEEEEIQRRQRRTKFIQELRRQKKSFFWPGIIFILFILFVLWLGVFRAERLPTSLSNCEHEAAPAVNWENCLKPKLNLENKDLSNAQLRNSELAGSNLMNSTLTGSNLAYADLHNSNLSYSQIQNVILKGANLRDADLSYSDLSNSDLSYSDLRGVNLGEAKLKNVHFDHAIWINGKVCGPQSIGQCKGQQIKIKPD